jgi:uncharacterized phage-associated protein
MSNEMISTASLLRKIGSISADVQQALRVEKGEEYDTHLIEESMRRCLETKFDAIEENMHELFTSPATREFAQLSTLLAQSRLEERAVEVGEAVELAQEFHDDSVFTGRRIFAKAKMAAMIEYLTAKGGHVYKTSLNKLLFYSDLTNYYLSGQGMSGAVYYNRRFGPVADPASSVLSELVNESKVRVEPRMQTLESSGVSGDILSDQEKKVLDWVSSTYGKMSASEISEFSHLEMAYKFTEANEPIAYEYAKFFKTLPPKSFLTSA